MGFEEYAFKEEQIPNSPLSTWEIAQGQESFPFLHAGHLGYHPVFKIPESWERCLLALHLDILID